MIMKMYTVFDRKAAVHMTPFTARSDGEASRMLLESMLGGQSKLMQFHSDYHLYGIGTFDDNTGEIIGPDHPEPVISVTELVEELQRVQRAAREAQASNGSTAQADLEDHLRNHGQEQH